MSIQKAIATAQRCEQEIIHETPNLYLNSKLEICLNGNTFAVVIGKAKSIEQAKLTMARLEKYPKNLNALRG